ncbi:MAG TPA: LapA family protein [Patescibacteria group bacterium]|nr:LapA family protein [Patescibacteria group bacterium]
MQRLFGVLLGASLLGGCVTDSSREIRNLKRRVAELEADVVLLKSTPNGEYFPSLDIPIECEPSPSHSGLWICHDEKKVGKR